MCVRVCVFGVQGLDLVANMQHLVVMTLNMLVKMNRSMNKTSALALCKMMELMKVSSAPVPVADAAYTSITHAHTTYHECKDDLTLK